MKYLILTAVVAVATILFLNVPKSNPSGPAVSVPMEEAERENAAPSESVQLGEREPTRSVLPLELVGTIIFADRANSVASIYFQASKASEAYREETPISNMARLVKIDRDRVYIRNLRTAQPEYLELAGFDSSRAVNTEAINSGDGKMEFQVRRSSVDEALRNLPEFLQQARAEPSRDSAGKINGFQLQWIAAGSLYEKLGLQKGDTLRAVNGEPLTSIERAVDLYQQFQNSSMIRLTLQRGKRQTEITYLIRE